MIKPLACCGLKYPPLKKTKQIPDKLVYYRCFLGRIHDFNMCTTTKPYYTSRMYCTKANIYLDTSPTMSSLFIAMIKSEPRKKGLGTEMLKLAQRFSKEIGCGGRIHLSADPQFTKDEVPHIFYRKFGMNTEDAEVNDKLDEYIKMGKNATAEEFPSMLMYYPPVPASYSKKDPEDWLTSLANFFRIF